jgi:hypothetical protein
VGCYRFYVPFHPESKSATLDEAELAGATVPFHPLSFACAGAMPPTAIVPTTKRPAKNLATVRFSDI